MLEPKRSWFSVPAALQVTRLTVDLAPYSLRGIYDVRDQIAPRPA